MTARKVGVRAVAVFALISAALVVSYLWDTSHNRHAGSPDQTSRPQIAGSAPESGPAPTESTATSSATSLSERLPDAAVDAHANRYGWSPPQLASVEDRQAYFDRLKESAPREIFADWDASIREARHDEIALRAWALGIALSHDSDRTVIEALRLRLLSRQTSSMERMTIIDVLGRARTESSTALLVDFLLTERGAVGGSNNELSASYARARDSLQEAVSASVGPSRNWALSSVLENAYQNHAMELTLPSISTVAQSIAYLGKPSGIEVLIAVAANPGASPAVQNAAMQALSSQRWGDSVASMVDGLYAHHQNEALTRSLVEGLIRIDTNDSQNALATFARSADEKGWHLPNDVSGQIRTTTSKLDAKRLGN